ncbi:MAG: hypothetical protein JNJ73_17180 [Hyphomonadaceae bacterium]|nr:hypothetical protein [Hyphomonadaceae bacterium]
MTGYLPSLLEELAARRKRLRDRLGDRGQGLFEMLILGGLVAGSLGLLLSPRLAAAAPWGFAMPLFFLAGYALLDARRQGALARGAPPERVQKLHDWLALALVLGTAAAGAAAFAIAFSEPPPPPPPDWQPPADAVSADIAPVP